MCDNCSEHKEMLIQNGCVDVEKEHDASFTKWFEQRVSLVNISFVIIYYFVI